MTGKIINHVYANIWLLSNFVQLFLLQIDSLWLTSDYEPFVAAEWNNGILMYASDVMFWRMTADRISSPLQPGIDGNCAVILYIREHKPSWVMLPCGKLKSRYWICKNRPRVENVIKKLGYPSLWCRGRCLLIRKTCYQYKLLHIYSNSSIDCSVDDPYLMHLNSSFANHVINVKFSVDCTDVELCKKVQRRELVHQASKNKNQLTHERKLQFRKTTTTFSICGPAMQKCDDGSCRAQSIICTLDFQCSWNLCACTTSTSVIESINYCRYLCPPDICICSPFMFQCSTGGCIPYSHVCDNVYDCADSSDEFCIGSKAPEDPLQNRPIDLRLLVIKYSIWCFGFICSSGLCIDVNFVNDLIPDCNDARDEYHSLAMKYHGLHFYCNDMQKIPCIPGHSKCFEIYYLCVYDHDTFGHISHCRDGAHLLNCRYIKCTNMFKCPESYCIPLRKVCDGIYDCYGGKDENNCHKNICPGYLKCSEVEFCIHPTELCDGHPHCPHRDDEEVCDFSVCPTGCGCLGRGVVCRGEKFTYIPEINFRDVIYFSVVSGYIHSPSYSNLSSLLGLTILDLSGSNIVDICQGFQTDYNFYDSLHALYLQRNNINYLSAFCFTKLLSLLVINLENNPLADIADDAFKDISLNILTIGNTLLSSITGKWVDGFRSLKTLVTRRVKLSHFSHAAVDSLNELATIDGDDPKLCCILRNLNVCHDKKTINLRCALLLSRAILSPLLIIITVSVLLFITLSLWLVAKQFAITRPVQCFLHISILINRSLCVICVLATVVVDVFHGKHYIFWHRTLLSKLLWQGLQVIFSNGIVMSNISTSLLDHIAYMAVFRMLFNEKNVIRKVKNLLCFMHILMMTVFSLITFVLHKKLDRQYSNNHLCDSALGVSFNDHALLLIGPMFISVGIFLSLIHSIWAYSAIFRNAYASGKSVQMVVSTEMNIHRTRLSKLSKTLLHFTAFRSLECLPIICIVFVNVYGSGFGIEAQLMTIIISIVLGCVGNTIPLVWYATSRQNN